jgi:hypothetical protein
MLHIKKLKSKFALCFGAISSVGSEHLVYTQRVGGSNPSSPTTQKPVTIVAGFVFERRTRLAWIRISKTKPKDSP